MDCEGKRADSSAATATRVCCRCDLTGSGGPRLNNLTAGNLLADDGCVFQDSSGHEALTAKIIGCAIRVHSFFGAGLLESIYHRCLVFELETNGLQVESNRTIPLVYRGHSLDACFRADCIVEKTVLVEVKAVSELAPIHSAQVITYLKLTGCPVGLLINFNSPVVSANVRHLVHPDLYKKREKH